MFRAVPMVHLQVQVPSRDGPAVTRRIAAQGLLHLVDIGHGAASLRSSSTCRELLARFRDLARIIRQTAGSLAVPLRGITGTLAADDVTDFAVEHDEIQQQFEPIRASVDEVLHRIASARDAAQRGQDELERERRLDAAAIEVGRVQPLRFTYVRFGVAAPAELASVGDALSPNAFAIVPIGPASGRQLAAVAAPAALRDTVDAALRLVNFEALDTTSPIRDRREIRDAIEAAEQAEAAARRDLQAIAAQARSAIQALAHRAELAIVLLQAQTFYATAGRFLVISGWIPEERAPELAATLARVTEGRAVVSIEKPETLPSASMAALGVPILYRNPLLLRPFQQLVDLYGVPSYEEVQPTAFFAVSFLLMFGLMFGDVGHGAVLVAAGYCLFRYMPRFLDYGILLMEAGAASAIFGALYGSVFGVEDWLPSLWLHPIRDIARFTKIAALFGVAMVSTGFVLGVVNAWRGGERVAALVGVRGLFGAFAYWTIAALAARMFLPVEWIVSDGVIATLCAAAIALLVVRPAIVKLFAQPDAAARTREGATPVWLTALEASVELVDAIVSYFANTISYVRVAAFAAVHAAVLVAVFAMADTLARYRFGGWLSVGVLVGGNVVTILLEGLTVTVQALRLEYYEFFSKFFKGGGEPYRPLMLKPNGLQGDV